jgi:hypothetical protein
MRTRARAGRLNAQAAKNRIRRAARVLWMPVLAGLIVAAAGCGVSSGLFRQYEYEEEIYLSLDGTATVYVNSSIAALNALRGTSFDAAPTARVDRPAIRAYYSGAGAQATRVTESRRNGRRYVHVRLELADITRLGALAPFAWSTYRFQHDGSLYIYQQMVGAAAPPAAARSAWNGKETVAFRLHLPSKIRYHNTRREVRGNILEWEQPLAERLRGDPLVLDARMDAQSILYRTLWLFGATFVAVAIAFVVVIWWVMRRGSAQPPVQPAR